MINVRLAKPADAGAIWEIFQAVIQTGDTYALANGATGFAAINTDVELILADTRQRAE